MHIRIETSAHFCGFTDEKVSVFSIIETLSKTASIHPHHLVLMCELHNRLVKISSDLESVHGECWRQAKEKKRRGLGSLLINNCVNYSIFPTKTTTTNSTDCSFISGGQRLTLLFAFCFFSFFSLR